MSSKISKILSLNISKPEKMQWKDQEVMSSMRKKAIDGFLQVNEFNIDGDEFQSPQYHGTPDSVLYAFGLDSAKIYLDLLGRDENYLPGTLGENITLSELDEKEVFVGDVFKIGEVLAQATFPRIPCGKVNIRMQHNLGQKLLMQSGRSGVYFRILKPGRIHHSDDFQRFEKAKGPTISIFDLYATVQQKKKITDIQIQKLLEIESLPKDYLAELKKLKSS